MKIDKQDGARPGGEQNQAMLVGLVLLLAIFAKIWPRIHGFWIDHCISIVLLIVIVVVAALLFLLTKLWNMYVKRWEERGVTKWDNTSVYLGTDFDTGETVDLKQEFRCSHIKVIGTTGTGKTASAVEPIAIQDIKNGSGLLIIDGKSEASFAVKLYAHVKFHEREKDFRFFSLANTDKSWSFNPLRGETAQEVTERVFSSFTFENEYYRHVQYKLFLNLIRLIYIQNQVPTFSLVHRLMVDMDALAPWVEACSHDALKLELTRFMKLSEREREEKISGLDSMLSHFSSGDMANLFEETENRIDIEEAMEQGHVLYFQLPTMYYPVQAAVTGKLVLQCLQSAVSKRQFKMEA